MEDSSELVSKLTGMLKEKNIDINDVLSKISNSSTNSSENVDNTKQSSTTNSNLLGDLDFETIMKIKGAMNKMSNSERNNLLQSLKPYLRDSRKEKLDSCIKLANMSSLIELFK